MRRAFLLLAMVAVCLAQTATPPAISAWYRLTGNSAGPYPYQWLLIDPPLALSFDGVSPHLGITGVAGATGPQGGTGVQGAPGVAGAPGPQGAAGSPGGPGLAVESGCATVAGCVTLGTATTLDIEPGIGVLCIPQISATTSTMTLQCSSDTSIIAYRVDPSTASGPCVDPATNQPYGASTWAADSSYFYTCAPVVSVPPTNGLPVSFVWARTPLQTGW